MNYSYSQGEGSPLLVVAVCCDATSDRVCCGAGGLLLILVQVTPHLLDESFRSWLPLVRIGNTRGPSTGLSRNRSSGTRNYPLVYPQSKRSDRCRIAASRVRRRSEREPSDLPARAHHEREQVARLFGTLTPASLDLLVELQHRDAALALVVGQALARERDQALANQRRVEYERLMQTEKARKLGAELGYPEVEALDLGQGVRLFAYRGVAQRAVLEEWYEG